MRGPGGVGLGATQGLSWGRDVRIPRLGVEWQVSLHDRERDAEEWRTSRLVRGPCSLKVPRSRHTLVCLGACLSVVGERCREEVEGEVAAICELEHYEVDRCG